MRTAPAAPAVLGILLVVVGSDAVSRQQIRPDPIGSQALASTASAPTDPLLATPLYSSTPAPAITNEVLTAVVPVSYTHLTLPTNREV